MYRLIGDDPSSLKIALLKRQVHDLVARIPREASELGALDALLNSFAAEVAQYSDAVLVSSLVDDITTSELSRLARASIDFFSTTSSPSNSKQSCGGHSSSPPELNALGGLLPTVIRNQEFLRDAVAAGQGLRAMLADIDSSLAHDRLVRQTSSPSPPFQIWMRVANFAGYTTPSPDLVGNALENDDLSDVILDATLILLSINMHLEAKSLRLLELVGLIGALDTRDSCPDPVDTTLAVILYHAMDHS
ncbi:hypothetical protein K523DRAFT_422135 [Schizophyllum commune Tattone D]|nr:hypothetical protein K523DRAFT_422135 [Schizophyllum commune Tattone D]